MGNVRQRRSQRGFSLIEAIVAAGILGIALLGLVELHKGSMRGTVRAQRIGDAAEVARQLAEQVAAQDFNQLPACNPGAGPSGGQLAQGAPNGCRSSLSPTTVFNPQKPNGCTYFVDGAAVRAVDPSVYPDAAAGTNQLRYRVDLAISQHPDNINYPDSAMVTVWVCWTEERGTIREIATSRIVWL